MITKKNKHARSSRHTRNKRSVMISLRNLNTTPRATRNNIKLIKPHKKKVEKWGNEHQEEKHRIMNLTHDNNMELNMFRKYS